MQRGNLDTQRGKQPQRQDWLHKKAHATQGSMIEKIKEQNQSNQTKSLKYKY